MTHDPPHLGLGRYTLLVNNGMIREGDECDLKNDGVWSPVPKFWIGGRYKPGIFARVRRAKVEPPPPKRIRSQA